MLVAKSFGKMGNYLSTTISRSHSLTGRTSLALQQFSALWIVGGAALGTLSVVESLGGAPRPWEISDLSVDHRPLDAPQPSEADGTRFSR